MISRAGVALSVVVSLALAGAAPAALEAPRAASLRAAGNLPGAVELVQAGRPAPPERGSSAMLGGGSSADRYGGTSADHDGVAGPRDRPGTVTPRPFGKSARSQGPTNDEQYEKDRRLEDQEDRQERQRRAEEENRRRERGR